MRRGSLEGATAPRGPLAGLDPRWPVLGTLAFVLAVAITPRDAWRIMGVEGLVLAFALGLSGIDPATLARRWMGFLALVGSLAVMVAWGVVGPDRAASTLDRAGLALGILAKNALAFGAVLGLTAASPFPALLRGLSKLGVPAVLVTNLHFLYRYVFVLLDELGRMIQARRARRFRRSGRLDWGLLAGGLGVLFVRALERGERVHAAMLARGWDGTLSSLDPIDLEPNTR